jgi:polyisoprenoid-binding protein YceI
MKKTGILILAVVFITMSFTNKITTIQNTLNVDVSSSTITWKGYKPTGSHTGTIMLKSGTLTMEDEYIIGGSFTADMSTIKDEDGSERLEGHLKNEDFFEIETYPTAKFDITEVEMEDGNATITGNMTIKGITKEISFEAEISETDETVTLSSSVFQINRADFNVKYKSKTFFNDLKDKFVNDEFDLQVALVANK